MTVHTREIAREEWGQFFDKISRHYLGRLVKVELLGADLGVRVVAQGLPLIGITAEHEAGGRVNILLVAGNLKEGHVTHAISDPRHVWIEQEINGSDNAIEILSNSDYAVIIELSAPQPGAQAPGRVAMAF
jgi:hypothetical protein